MYSNCLCRTEGNGSSASVFQRAYYSENQEIKQTTKKPLGLGRELEGIIYELFEKTVEHGYVSVMSITSFSFYNCHLPGKRIWPFHGSFSQNQINARNP